MDPKRRLFNEKYEPASEGSDQLFETVYEPAAGDGVECLGMTFESEDARRQYFLERLRAGLDELHAQLDGVPFTTVEDAVARMGAIAAWPMGDEERLRELAQRMAEAHRQDRDKDLLQLWKDEVGFPHGEIEDILALSDPPYYTACPNPFLDAFVRHYGKPYDPQRDAYRREPFAADVSEGKNDPIYNAHSYHTKVPHKAIMRYILHYTEPGDVVLDGFAGTGMTGVAAQLCGDRATVESLGYKVDDQGVIYQREINEKGRKVWRPFSKLGPRRAVLNDLSPAATFIAYNYNTPVDVQAFEREATRILNEVEAELGWMYRTLAVEDEDLAKELAAQVRACRSADEVRALIESTQDAVRWGTINYTVWSDVFICPECTHEVVFWDAAVDKDAGKVHKEFPCPHCGAQLTKRAMDRAWVTRYDRAIGQTVRQAKQVPVLINYKVDKKRYEKKLDSFDRALIEKIEELDIPYWFPTDRMPEGDESRRNDRIGLTHVHHFYTKKNLWILASIYAKIQRFENSRLNKFMTVWFTSSQTRLHKMNRYMPQHQRHVGPLSGTLYISSTMAEISPLYFASVKERDHSRLNLPSAVAMIGTGSASTLSSEKAKIDYVFTDPPFGGNLMYSELNFLWEAWLKIFTNTTPEAITNNTQGKALPEYQSLMLQCFQQYYHMLKPGRWITVEFHNSQNRVWIGIQEALQLAGFVIADVRTLDKQKGTTKQLSLANATKQDLILSAYKPNSGLEDRFKLMAGTKEGAWDFIRTHLRQLPVFVTAADGAAEIIAERQAYLLYDRMVAYHVQRGVTVPYSAAEFYAELAQRFPERNEMYFLPDQAAEYDRKRMQVTKIEQIPLRIMDEASAIQWLRRQLSQKPQTFQELHPQFTQESSGWLKHETPLDLAELLRQNFLMYDGEGEVPSQIHSYLSSNYKELRNLAKDDPRLRAKAKDRWYVPDPNKAADLEKVRERALLREFERYKERKGRFKRNEKFRMEAIRAGFKKAWQERDYQTIINIAEKLPPDRLQEDPKLLMWYDQALTRLGEN